MAQVDPADGEPVSRAEATHLGQVASRVDASHGAGRGVHGASVRLTRRGRIAGLGRRPEDLHTIVATHYHYDHIGNLRAFRRARVVMSRAEYAFWVAEPRDRLVGWMLALLLPLAAQGQDPYTPAPFFTTPDEVVQRMLALAGTGPADLVADLGSGDGRIVIAAARDFGARGLGIELDRALVEKSRAAARQAGVAERVSFVQGDVLSAGFSEASVVTVYLLPGLINHLRPRFLQELRPGTRIVSHDYPLTGWIPEKYVQMDLEDKVQISGVTTTLIYLYVVPAKVAGQWSAKMPPAVSRQPATLELRQQLTRVSGSARLDGKELPLEEVRLRGDRISFRVTGRPGEFSGQVKGKTIEGEVVNGRSKASWSATLGG